MLALVGCGVLAASQGRAAAAQQVQVWNTPSRYIAKVDLLPADRDGGRLTTRVVLPDGYSSRRCWPVIYLLHGTGTDTTPAYKEWIDQMHADQSGAKAILVIPGGGPMWWVDNWWNGLRRPGWESWVLKELIPLVERRVHVCGARSEHAIAGYSMGGYGAAYLGSQRPDYFGSVGSFSGVIAPMSGGFPSIFKDFETYWGPAGGFWAAGHDTVGLAPNLAHTRVMVSVGDGRPVGNETIPAGGALEELEFANMASVFVPAAKKAHVPITFVQHSGAHTWITWQQDLQRFLAWNPFKRVTSAPPSWTYTTIAQQGTAWDYGYRFVRKPTALLTLTKKGRTLRAAGTGTLVVTGPGHLRVRAKLPFAVRDGVVRELKPSASKQPPASTTHPKVQIAVAPDPITPTSPITVSFTTQEALPAGQEYAAAYLSTAAGCSQTVVARVTQPKKGAEVRLTLQPGGDSANPRTTWCPGSGFVGVVAVPKGAAVTTQSAILGYAPVTIPSS